MAEVLPQAHWANFAFTLGYRVRVLRMMRGLTQARLAELAGVSRSLVSNLERNDYNGGRADPTLSTVYRLAAALHVPPAALLPGAEQLVEQRPRNDGLDVAFTWPRGPQDTARFCDEYLEPGAATTGPRYQDALFELD